MGGCSLFSWLPFPLQILTFDRCLSELQSIPIKWTENPASGGFVFQYPLSLPWLRRAWRRRIFSPFLFFAESPASGLLLFVLSIRAVPVCRRVPQGGRLFGEIKLYSPLPSLVFFTNERAWPALKTWCWKLYKAFIKVGFGVFMFLIFFSNSKRCILVDGLVHFLQNYKS